MRYTLTPVGSHDGGECFLLLSDKSAVLLDTGFEFCGDKTARNVRAALGDRRLDYILVTHSHFDHVGGVPAIKQLYPAAKVVASSYARKVVSLDGAKAIMRTMNSKTAGDAGIDVTSDRLDELAIDVVLGDGEALELPDMTITGIATPGHTKCCMSYYFEEEKLLVCSETLGVVPDYPTVRPCMIVGYQSTLESIDRCQALRPKHVFISHSGLIPEGDAEMFFANAQKDVERAAALVWDLHRQGRRNDEIVAAFTWEFSNADPEAPEQRAVVLNTTALVPKIINELTEASQKTA